MLKQVLRAVAGATPGAKVRTNPISQKVAQGVLERRLDQLGALRQPKELTLSTQQPLIQNYANLTVARSLVDHRFLNAAGIGGDLPAGVDPERVRNGAVRIMASALEGWRDLPDQNQKGPQLTERRDKAIQTTRVSDPETMVQLDYTVPAAPEPYVKLAKDLVVSLTSRWERNICGTSSTGLPDKVLAELAGLLSYQFEAVSKQHPKASPDQLKLLVLPSVQGQAAAAWIGTKIGEDDLGLYRSHVTPYAGTRTGEPASSAPIPVNAQSVGY